jgi:hypothetical protein
MAAGRTAMGNAGVAAALVALLLVAAASGAAAFRVCNVDKDAVVNSCKSYCTVGSTEAKPSNPCCAAVRGCNFKCLCQYKDYLSPDIDGNRAMQIPSKCGDPKAPTSC